MKFYIEYLPVSDIPLAIWNGNLIWIYLRGSLCRDSHKSAIWYNCIIIDCHIMCMIHYINSHMVYHLLVIYAACHNAISYALVMISCNWIIQKGQNGLCGKCHSEQTILSVEVNGRQDVVWVKHSCRIKYFSLFVASAMVNELYVIVFGLCVTVASIQSSVCYISPFFYDI